MEMKQIFVSNKSTGLLDRLKEQSLVFCLKLWIVEMQKAARLCTSLPNDSRRIPINLSGRSISRPLLTHRPGFVSDLFLFLFIVEGSISPLIVDILDQDRC